MDGRSINRINGETSTVGQMKAAAACLLISMDSMSTSPFSMRRSSWRFWMPMAVRENLSGERKGKSGLSGV